MRIETIINDILEDIRIFGGQKACYIIHSRRNPAIIGDYLVIGEDDEKVKYIDEQMEQSTLLDTLFEFVAAKKQAELGKITVSCVLICAARYILQLTQPSFAKLFNVSLSTVQSWETDRRNPTFKTLCKILKAANIPLEKIIEEV